MEIKIPLPICNSSANTYQELRGYLKQLELAVHHAQKAIESAEKEGVELSEDCFIDFKHPSLRSSLEIDAKKDNDKTLENLVDNYYEELQSVELSINLI